MRSNEEERAERPDAREARDTVVRATGTVGLALVTAAAAVLSAQGELKRIDARWVTAYVRIDRKQREGRSQ